ncbi:MAG: toxin-antitoxin system YwqK family antitoxin [Nitritalea sp.]
MLHTFGQQRDAAVQTIYSADSSLKASGVIAQGSMQGLWRFEDPKTGRLLQTANFLNGKREGAAQAFHPSGQKAVEANYRNGVLNGPFAAFDQSGALIEQKIYEDSVLVGPYKSFFGRENVPSFVDPGQVKEEGQYVNGKKDGRWMTYFYFGQLGMVQTFKEGVQEGPYMEYHPDGFLVAEVMYKGGEPHGPFKRFSFANVIEEEGEYNMGRKVGDWVTYFPGTKRVASETSYDARGNRSGTWTYYYENRRVARVERYENDIPVGTWEEFYPDRTLSKRKTYVLGVPVGPYEEFHANGNPSVTGEFSESGMRTGLWRNFHPEGQLYSIGEYRNNVKTGNWKYFNRIGILVAEGEYLLGSENGQWVYYYDGGQLKSIGSYRLGNEHGTWGLFYDNKQLTQEEFWSNGRLMNVGDYFSLDGSKTWDKGSLQDGNGIRITYYIDGRKESEGTYSDGRATGPWIYYHENGRKASEGEMIEGKKQGQWRYFNINGRLQEVLVFDNDELVPEQEPEPEINFQRF